MTTVRQPRTNGKTASIDALVERLSTRFPELSTEEIARAVRGEYAGYEASPIQDFVPILVERSVAADLAKHAPIHRA